MELAKSFEPAEIEKRWYAHWESAGYFKAGEAPDANAYCIMLPPPNVTGTLHMGHAFQHTLMDALTRYHRMSGDNTLWQPGTDHAGIATQMVVERQLAAQGVSRHDLGREKFLEKVWEWKEESGGTITRQELVDLTGDVEQSHTFFLCAYTPVYKWNDLDRRDSIWRLTLIGSDDVAVD